MNDELRMTNVGRKSNDDDKKYYLCSEIILKQPGEILQGIKCIPLSILLV
jgi:hypothetical protein